MSDYGEHSKGREGFYGVLASQACQVRVLSCARDTKDKKLDVISQELSTFLRQGCALAWDLPSRLGGLTREPERPSCLCLPSNGNAAIIDARD